MDPRFRDQSGPATRLPALFASEAREDGLPPRPPLRMRLYLDRSGEGLRLQSASPELHDRVTDPGPPPIQTETLLSRVARGEARAMEDCIGAHGGLVWAIVTRRVNDRSAAEDLVQEIFTEVWKCSGRHDPAIASESGFISMIARRRAIDWNRRQQRLPALEALPEIVEIPAETTAPGPGIDHETLWQALKRLPEETRKLFVLHFEQGMTHGEIAESTGLPLGSVKTRLRRGLIEARALLSRPGSGMNPSTEALS